MATYVPPKINTEFIFYITLVSQANTMLLQTNPTIAAGDFKVSTDGGAFGNPATLPAVTPASGKAVKVTLSTSEMNGGNVLLVASDAAGAEWCDASWNIQTSARQVDDLAFPTTSGRSLDVTATGAAGIDWANVENPTTPLNLSATNIDVDQVVASVSGAVGSVTGAVGSVTGNVGGNVTGSVGSVAAGGITAASIATDAIDADALAADAVTEIQAGLATAAALATVQADTDNIQTRLPAALVGGRMDSSVGAVANDAITAAAISADAGAEIADAILNRDMATGTDSGSATVRTPRQALRFLRNFWAIVGTTLTVYKEDDATPSWTSTLATTAGADPVTSSDPAGP